jgi:hypothetical protein
LFLGLVLLAVLFVRHTGGLSLGKIFDGVAPVPASTPAERSAPSEPSDGFRTSRDGLGRAKLDLPQRELPTYQHLEVRR